MPARETNCPDSESLGRYVEGALDAPERDRIEGHLAHCRQCRLVAGAARASRRADSHRTVVWWALGAAAAIMIAASLAVRLTGDRPGAGRIPSPGPLRHSLVTEERARLLEASFLSDSAGGVTIVPAEESETGSTELLVDPFPTQESADEAPANDARAVPGGNLSAG